MLQSLHKFLSIFLHNIHMSFTGLTNDTTLDNFYLQFTPTTTTLIRNFSIKFCLSVCYKYISTRYKTLSSKYGKRNKVFLEEHPTSYVFPLTFFVLLIICGSIQVDSLTPRVEHRKKLLFKVNYTPDGE